MLRRNSKLEFAGGMWVFPGGRVDPEDYPADAPDDVEAAVRVGRGPGGRRRRPASPVTPRPWSRSPTGPRRWWPSSATPPGSSWPRRPTGAVTIDDGEIHESVWARPEDTLARRDAGEVELAPPTWVTLDRLSRSATVAEALDEARIAPVEAFVTAIGKDGDDLVALWHGDAGYETGDASVPGPRHRLVMSNTNPWRYDRDC